MLRVGARLIGQCQVDKVDHANANRPLTDSERALARWMLEHGSDGRAARSAYLLSGLEVYGLAGDAPATSPGIEDVRPFVTGESTRCLTTACSRWRPGVVASCGQTGAAADAASFG